MATRRRQPDLDIILDGDLALPQRLSLIASLRGQSSEESEQVDLAILSRLGRRDAALAEQREQIAQLSELVDQLTTPPWHTALYMRCVEQDGWRRALVASERSFRLIEIASEVDESLLVPGVSVFLSSERNILVGVARDSLLGGGETAFFERRLEGGRLIVKQRDEEIIVDAASALEFAELQPGDELRLERAALMALERIELGEATRYLVDTPLALGPEALGGQDAALRQLLDALMAALLDPKLAESYQLSGRCSVLLNGPPGCGKTLMTRIAAHQLDLCSARGAKFFTLKPGELESPWVGETQANIRNAFKSIRKAANGAMAVLLIDEVESIARHRGSGLSHHADLFAAAWLAELDGFQDRGEVAIVTATNRADLLDAAFYQRISDVKIDVGRPDLAGARSIFGIHLDERVPVRPNGEAAAATREELIETAVSRLYAPNAENTLAVLHFRDGSARPVGARELISGRVIEQVCRAARSRAFARHVRGGSQGVQMSDMCFATAGALDRLGGVLSRSNASQYLPDLPEDAEVVRVERPKLRIDSRVQYTNGA